MDIKRKCRNQPLSKQPLALVLIQINFTPIANIGGYVNLIQDEFRKSNYPDFEVQDNISITITPDGIKHEGKKLWMFSSADSFTNILLDTNQLLFQTSDYSRFEEFYERFETVLNIVLQKTGYKESGHCIRCGLRYVDQIIPLSTDDAIDSYLNPGLTLFQPDVFKNQAKMCNTSLAGEIHLLDGKKNGGLVIRTTQGEENLFLPPDLLPKAPKLKRDLPEKCKIGLIDMDASCFFDKTAPFDVNELKAVFYSMHDIIIETFYDSIVSKEGVRKWS